MENQFAKLSRLLEQMQPSQRAKFYESRKNGSPVEVQLNCAEAILAGKVKESAPITKHNGRADNGGELFTESDGDEQITETICAKGDAVLYRELGISEADQRSLKNLPPVGSPNLTPAQLREYRFLRSIRLSESAANSVEERVYCWACQSKPIPVFHPFMFKMWVIRRLKRWLGIPHK